MRKLISVFISSVLFLGMLCVPVFADNIKSVTASIDPNKLVTVRGTIDSGAGRLVNVKITDPEGDTEYIGTTVSASYGSFTFSYAMTNNSAGRYMVTVSTLGVSTPAGAYFDYGTDNSLSSLSISQGAFDTIFASFQTQYSATVDNRVKNLTVTPTANDSTSVIKVNNTAVSSGSPSGSITLVEGTNTISVLVTALNGSTKTYLIKVTRLKALSATLTANASIDVDKQVMVSGSVSSGAGQLVSVKIIGPNGNTEYAGTATSVTGGGFQLKYNMSNTIMGRYDVSVGSLGVALPAAVYFDYGIDAGLKSLTINSGALSPAFQPGVTSYSVDVGSSVNSVTVTPVLNDSKASLKANDKLASSGIALPAISLHNGANTLNLLVTAQDGITQKTYTINVYRAAPLPVGANVNAKISKEKLVTISGTVTSSAPQITVMITDPNGKLEYLNTAISTTNGAFSFSYLMTNTARGRYYVSIGALGLASPAQTYFVYDPGNADLKGLSIGSAALSPAFSSGITAYSASITYDTSSVSVTPTTSDPYASVQVNDVSVPSGSPSGYVKLNVGDNAVSVVVTSQDGTKKSYTIVIKRAPAPPPSQSQQPPPNQGNNNPNG